jgi:RimJ/RimL family protein N-acetyltransferase
VQNLFRSWSKKFSSRNPTPYPLTSASGRIYLQPLESAEVKLVEDWFKDRETCELAFGVKASWDVLSAMRSEYIEELQRDKVGVLSVRLATSPKPQRPVGFVRYKLYRRGRKKSARVGIILGPPEVRGGGIGSEAFQTLIDYLFETRGVMTVELDTAVFNTKARHCFESCGFVAVREVEFSTIHSEVVEKRLMMKLDRADWDKRKTTSPQ